MTDPLVARMHAWLAEHEASLVADCRGLLQIPSVKGDPEPTAPFGAANRDALDYMLGLAHEQGMRTRDIEGYCGYAEFGVGDPMVMILGHLDVVPVGDGWKHTPFGAEIDDGYLYARGAVDDKGPTMAAFYAAMALKACMPEPNVRIRAVFGCDEESGFRCISRYNKTEEAPTFGIAPDALWPMVHAEKGIANLVIEAPLPGGDFALLSIKGGERANVVLERCTARVRVGDAVRSEVEAALAEAWDRNVTFAWEEGHVLAIDALGKAAHGSTPYWGDNAAIRVLRFLVSIAPLTSREQYADLFRLPQTQGEGVGIAGADEVSGALSCNLGVVNSKEGTLAMTLNVRYPVTWKGEQIKSRCKARLEQYGRGYTLAKMSDSPSLYFPTDHPMVKAIAEVYTTETGEQLKPQVIGGGTYARAIANTVSIGTGWLGDGGAHEHDERVKVEHLHRMSRIYAHVLLRLVKLAASA
ncbi:MAG: Sapep family Mn(2+)-dependent dipeptidase [Myxococcota bacterium]